MGFAADVSKWVQRQPRQRHYGLTKGRGRAQEKPIGRKAGRPPGCCTGKQALLLQKALEALLSLVAAVCLPIEGRTAGSPVVGSTVMLLSCVNVLTAWLAAYSKQRNASDSHSSRYLAQQSYMNATCGPLTCPHSGGPYCACAGSAQLWIGL